MAHPHLGKKFYCYAWLDMGLTGKKDFLPLPLNSDTPVVGMYYYTVFLKT